MRALSFTGSTEIGRLLYGQCARTIKRLTLELGGHAPFLVFADADLDQAVEEGIKAKFATSGQDCLAANRMFVERPVYDAFCERFAAAAARLTVGRGIDDPDIGPLMNPRAVEKQEEHIRDALDRGARLLTGGARHPAGPLCFQPTVLADVPHDALIFREETFGPVAGIAAFDTEDEAVRRANETEMGLVAYLHTMDPRRIYRVTARFNTAWSPSTAPRSPERRSPSAASVSPASAARGRASGSRPSPRSSTSAATGPDPAIGRGARPERS